MRPKSSAKKPAEQVVKDILQSIREERGGAAGLNAARQSSEAGPAIRGDAAERAVAGESDADEFVTLPIAEVLKLLERDERSG